MNSRTIQISLPKLPWKIFFKPRVAAAGLLLGAAVYWYFAIHPYLCIDSAHLAAPYLEVQSDRAGRIVFAPHEEGSFIRQGEILFSLNSEEERDQQTHLQERVKTLEQAVASYETSIERSMKDYFSIRTEVDLGLSSEEDAEGILSNLEGIQGLAAECREQISTAKMNMDRLALQLKQKAVAAPFSGVVVKQQKRLGDIVQFGETIYSFCDPSHLWVEAVVPEKAIARVQIGQKATVQLLADSSRKWHGKVSWISPVALPAGEGVPIRLSLDRTDGPLLLPNLTASVKLKVR